MESRSVCACVHVGIVFKLRLYNVFIQVVMSHELS